MRPAEKNAQNKPAASIPDPRRRKFLKNILIAGALAPIACSKEGKAPEESRKTIYQNRELRLGISRIILEECRNDGKIQSAKFRIFREGRTPTDSISLAVPGYLSMGDCIPGYEVYVESILCGKAPSACLAVTHKPAEEGPNAASSDLPVIASAIAFAASLILWAVRRREEAAENEPIILSPKRPEH